MPEIYYSKKYEAGYRAGLRAARRDIGRDFGDSRPKAAAKRRKSNPWTTHLKRFQYRKKRRNESTQDYLVARTKAAKRKYKSTRKGQVRKTARRAYKK